MATEFFPNAEVMLIGSQPLDNHDEASALVMTHAGAIPNWVQLPVFPQEGMIDQFSRGLPGLTRNANKLYADHGTTDFEEQMLAFFQEYLAAHQAGRPDDDSRFALIPETAPGFFTLLEKLFRNPADIKAVKGQVTGPITFCTAIKDQHGRAIFYHDGLRDASVKLLALNAAWQVKKLKRAGVPVIMFIDEPALAGYGSSELISISQEQISICLEEVVSAIHEQGGLAGVHVCANTDWSLLLNSRIDIVNFDAYGYFDKFILYGEQIKAFLEDGRYLAWGLVPTLRLEEVAKVDLDALWRLWQSQSRQVIDLGIDEQTLRRQSFITPSCGTGSLPREAGQKVLVLTRALSQRIREMGTR